MCLDQQTPALKTCLKCEISMCAQHLQAHLTTPVLLQTHPLTKPTAPGCLNSGSVRCPEHGKLLEYYCLDDRTCACVSCSIEDQHRLHNMKTLPSAHKVLVEKLRKEMEELAEREKQSKVLKSWETEQTKTLEKSGKQLVKRVLALRDAGLSKIQSSVTARHGAIQTARQNIQSALSEEDMYAFLERYAGVHEAVEKARAVDFIHGLEDEAEPGDVVFNLVNCGHEVVKEVKKLQRDLLVLVDHNGQYWGEKPTTSMTFDPKTLGEHFLLSSDFKMLSCRSPIQQHVSQTVYFTNHITEDLHWTLRFSEKYAWSVGFSAGRALSNAQNGWLHCPVYGLERRNKQFLALHTIEHPINPNCYGQYGNYQLVRDVITCLSKSGPADEDIDFQNKVEVHVDTSTWSLTFFIKCENEIIRLHSEDIELNYRTCLQPFVHLEKTVQDPPVNNYTRSHGDTLNSSAYVDLVCALDENLHFLQPWQKGQDHPLNFN